MSRILLEESAIEDLDYWAKNDVKLLKKIINLISAISQSPFDGIGKPEPLKGNLQGYWSRRIDQEHRIVYTVRESEIIIIACRYHYK